MDWNQHVYPHGLLEPVADRMWMVTGSLRWSPLPRNMYVYELEARGLLIYSAVALDQSGMTQLESLGSPRIILVPGYFHRSQVDAWKQRYPHARVLCPAAARGHVSKKVEVDGSAQEELPRLGITYHAAPGVKAREGIYEFPVGSGAALLFCDSLMNLDHFGGITGWLMCKLKSTGSFGVTPLARRMILSDPKAFKAWLEQQSTREDLVLLGPAHGAPIAEDCARRLREAADKL